MRFHLQVCFLWCLTFTLLWNKMSWYSTERQSFFFFLNNRNHLLYKKMHLVESYLVGLKGLCRGTVLATVQKGEGLCLCVTKLMFPQVGNLKELLPALGTPVAPLSHFWAPSASFNCPIFCSHRHSIRMWCCHGNLRFCRGLCNLRETLPHVRLSVWVWVDREFFYPAGLTVNLSWFSSQTRATADRASWET